MYLVFLIAITMVAFASNSILTRLAVDAGHIDPSGFAILRVLSGAITLGMIVSLKRGGVPVLCWNSVKGAVSLTIYMVGFSLAYLTLDAGLGALILFGVTQMLMFAYSVHSGQSPSRRQITGAIVAFIGLLIALWPGPGGMADLSGAALMVFAGISWGIYSILGRKAVDPLAATAANFILCLPMITVLLIGTGMRSSITGVALAILCGGLTSGLGYALWYRVLPQLQSATAAVVQLSVPIIAVVAGAVFLDERVSLLLVISVVFVVGGIAWSVTAPSRS